VHGPYFNLMNFVSISSEQQLGTARNVQVFGSLSRKRYIRARNRKPLLQRQFTSVNRVCIGIMTEPERSSTMNNTVFWDVTPCGSCKSVLTRATRCHIPDYGSSLPPP
jgi:hypothetical protein